MIDSQYFYELSFETIDDTVIAQNNLSDCGVL